jgi:hypothetical protein
MASQYELNEDRTLDDEVDAADSDDISASDDSKNPLQEDFNIVSRERVRSQLQSQIEAFLARGGKINEIPNRAAEHYRPGKPANEHSGSFI